MANLFLLAKDWSIKWLRKYTVVWNLSILAFLLGVMFWLYPTTVVDLRLLNSPPREILVPHLFSEDPAEYTIEATLLPRPFPFLTLHADDCIDQVMVDGETLFAETCSSCLHCDPIRVALPSALAVGKHRLTIRYQNISQRAVLDIHQAYGFGALECGFVLIVGLVWMGVVRRRRMSMWLWWLGVGAVLLAISYYLTTDPWTRHYDIEGHQEYIQYIREVRLLPEMQRGWETFQPPLYYLISAWWMNLQPTVLLIEPWRWLQFLAVILYSITVLVAILFWKKLGYSPIAGWLGLMVFIFLPPHVFLSARISNDIFLPLGGMLVTFFLWRYAQDDRRVYLLSAALVLVAGLLTKTSCLPLLAGSGLFVGWLEWRKHQSPGRVLNRISWVALPGILVTLIWGLHSFGQTGYFFYNNASFLNPGLAISNDPSRYLSFDLASIRAEGYANTWGGQVRNSLVTFFLITAVWGQFNFAFLHWGLLEIMVWIFLPIAVLPVIGLIAQPKSIDSQLWLLTVVLVGCHALFMLAYNWVYPFSPNQDFRLWAPVFFPIALLGNWGYQVCLNKAPRNGRVLLKFIPTVFFVLLALFYVALLAP